MNPRRIAATNMRTFERLDLNLPVGCTVIAGPNGAGKSTLLNLIDVALFAGRGELAALLTLGEDDLELKLEFEHGGEMYRVRRGFSARGRGKTTFDLERTITGEPSDDLWEPLTRETTAATQAELESILGLSRETFRASSFLAQGDGDRFTSADASQRKAVLAEILGLHLWDQLLEKARAELRGVQDEHLELRGRASMLEEAAVGPDEHTVDAARRAAADAMAARTLAETAHTEALQKHADNAARLERARAADQAARVAAEAQERARQEYARAVQAGTDREQRQQDLEEAAQAADRVPELEQRLQAAREIHLQWERSDQLTRQTEQIHERARAREEETEALARHADDLDTKALHLEQHIDESGECDRCGQTLGAEAAARAAASFRAEAVEAKARVAAIRHDALAIRSQAIALDEQVAQIQVPEQAESIDVLSARLAEARSAGERRAALAEQVRALAEFATRSDEFAVAFTRARNEALEAADQAASEKATVENDTRLHAAILTARRNLDELTVETEKRNSTLVALELQLNRAAEAREELATIAARRVELDRQVDVLKLAERAFGRDGIPALIVENAAIPQLELEANRILGELGGATADCRIELRTQRALKTSDQLRETLAIVIITSQGERPYETFSGGERTRLNLALRIALARLLAHRRGADSRLLAIDEPEFLDEAGVARLAEVLRGLSGDFDRVLLVSHHPTLAASFDQAITVEKDGDRSRIGQLEAVPA